MTQNRRTARQISTPIHPRHPDVRRWVRKGVPLHPSKGSPKWGQWVNPFGKKGTPLRPEGLTSDDLGVQSGSAGGREARKMVYYICEDVRSVVNILSMEAVPVEAVSVKKIIKG